MQTPDSNRIELVPQPLTAEAFAPFGNVITFSKGRRRTQLSGAFDRTGEAAFPSIWISHPARAGESRVQIQKLERHPYSAQTFVPINGGRYLIVACHHDPAGNPDLSSLRAFIAAGNQGITYHRDVWHHGLTALDVKTEFVVAMTLSGKNEDDVFVDLDVAVAVSLPAESGNFGGM